MEYINETVLNTAISRKEQFKNNIQFPWMNIKDFIHKYKFKLLFDNFLPYDVFEKRKDGVYMISQRVYNEHNLQEPWDKLSQYEYWEGLARDLKSKEYREFLNDMFEEKMKHLAIEFFILRKNSGSRPHCDMKRKIGSHLFYLLPSDYWDPSWGGQTEIILTDKKESEQHTSYRTSLDQLNGKTIKPIIVDNHSLLFKKTDRSWHFVDAINCPPDKMRIMFQLIAMNSY